MQLEVLKKKLMSLELLLVEPVQIPLKPDSCSGEYINCLNCIITMMIVIKIMM